MNSIFCAVRLAIVLLILQVPASAASLSVVINEIQYHPADDLSAGEFVEVLNAGRDAADLSGWVLEGGIRYTFPAGLSLEPGGFLVVAASPAALVAQRDLDASRVLGPFTGVLDNAGEDLELRTGDGYVMSFAHYRDADPWPETPDGLGPTLERISAFRDEHDPDAWAASLVVGGTPLEANSVRVPDAEPPPGDSVLIPSGSVWRYWKGTSNPPAGWATPTFDDAAWTSGPAGFGYQDGDDTTVLQDMQNGYSTLYIRRTFQLADPSVVQSLSLAVSYDDGFVAYLNGMEVGRANVGGAVDAPVPFNALSTDFVEPAATSTLDLTPRRDLLRAGVNVVAVVGVNRALDNGDFSIHPSLGGVLGGGSTQPAEYIAEGATWKFFRGLSAPPQDWRDLSFVDDSWEQGAAGFGYADGDDATVLSDMVGNYVTVFIRHSFQVADATEVTALSLFVNYDDGFIAYLNGVEVARSNVDAAGHDQPASGSHEAGIPEEFVISSPSTFLRTGLNVLAIQGHNADIGSTDFSLSPSLAGEVTTHGGGPGPAPPPTPPPQDLVINEVFRGQPGQGWLELHNASTGLLDVGGRRVSLFPDSNGSFTVPTGTSLPAGGKLVLSEAQLGFAPGEAHAVILSLADGRWLDAINPREAPVGASTGRWPDGASNRYVFPTPTRDAPNQITLEDRVVIHEIMYHPAQGNTGGEYIELQNRGSQPVEISGWSFTRGIDYTFPAGTSLPAGGFLVLAQDPQAARTAYGIPLPLGPWVGQLKNSAESLLLRDALKNPVDRVRYADEGTWPEEPDGSGPSLELVHASIDNRWGPAWRASTGQGTPGAQNSAHVADPAPVIAGVEHAPAVPAPEEQVLVTASITDERPLVSATLFWRVDGAAGNPTQVPMVDDGIGDDGIAGNRIYGARIPPRPDRAIVLYWIQAAAQGGQSVTAPQGAPTPAYLYQVETPGPARPRPLYRLVLTAADLNSLRTRGTGTNTLLNCAFVQRGRSYQLRGVRYRGSSARSCDPLSYRVQFDHDVSLDGMKDLNLNGCNVHRQWIGLDFLSRTGLPTPQSWLRTVALNGSVFPDLFLRVEAIEEEFLERTLPPGTEGGNLYRGVSQANLDYRGDSQSLYEPDYEKHSNSSTSDWSDIVDLCFRMDADTTSNADYPAAVEAAVDVEEWALFFATFAILGSTENSLLLNNGDDYYLYRRPSDGKWMLLPWDLDSCFDEATQVLFRPSVTQVRRFLQHPRYAPIYWCYVEALLDSAFRADIVQSRIDQIASLFSAGRISQLRAFEPARRAYVDPRISRTLAVREVTGGTFCGSALVTPGGTLSLTGLAPTCGTFAVQVNGSPATFDVLTGAWSTSRQVTSPGTLTITAVDLNGLTVSELQVPVRQPTQGTPVPASIPSSRTLTRSGSPHVVTGATTVAQAATLTLEAGATLILDQGASLVVNGKLVAEGTAEAPVRIEAASCGGSAEGIVLAGTGPGHRFVHCQIVGLTGAAGAPAGITVVGSGALLQLVDIVCPAGATALGARPGSSLTVESSTIRGGATGLLVQGGNASVKDCVLRTTSREGALFLDGAGAIVEDTLILNCGTGLASAGQASLLANHVTMYQTGVGCDARERSAGAGGGQIELESSIIWATPVPIAEEPSQPAQVNRSNLSTETLREGPGNLNVDPKFVDVASGDFRLRFASPCRASGLNGTDMGAFPYVATGETSIYLRCDVRGDGTLDLADAVALLFELFAGGTPAACAAARDCNGDGSGNVSDAIFSLTYLFSGGPPPAGDFPSCEEIAVEQCGATTCPQ